MTEDTDMLGLIRSHQDELVDLWVRELRDSTRFREDLMGTRALREQCKSFLTLVVQGLETGGGVDMEAQPWEPLREYLSGLLRDWIDLGLTGVEVSAFLMLFQKPVFELLSEKEERAARSALRDLGLLLPVLNRLTMWIADAYQRRLQGVISRQQADLLELSTPVVELWDGVLALPLIGTLDTARTQVVMESILNRIAETGADVAIIDITGVPTVDTMVAQHLLKAVTAARLMGATCIISGIRPAIAQTMVQLGVDLHEVTTKQTMADAFKVALTLKHMGVRPIGGCDE